MAKDQDNIHVFGGDDDSVYLGELGSTLPTDLSAPTEQEDVGFLHEDGMSLNREADVTKFRAHQGAQVVRTKVTSSSKTISFTALESNPVTKALVDTIKDTQTAGGVTTETISSSVAVWVGNAVVDLYDGDYVERYAIPRFEVTVSGEEPWSNSDLRAYSCQGEIIGDYYRISGSVAPVESSSS